MNNYKILFIDVNYIKERSSVMENVEEKFIANHILEAQEIHIQEILGSNLYYSLLNDFNTDTNTFSLPKYKTLVEEYIQPCLLYYTLYESLDDLYAKVTNKSILIQNSENSTPISEAYLTKRKADFLNKAEYFSTRLTNYLIDNKNIYTEYLSSSNKFSDIKPKRNTYLINGWYLKNTKNDC